MENSFRHLSLCLVVIISLFNLPMIVAQEYEVVSFEIAPKDMTARMKGRLDSNGRKCAVLKVYVADNIAAVRGSVVGDILSTGMERLIYMSHDAKELEIIFDNHLPLQLKFIDYDYPSLTGLMTYVCKLEEKSTARHVGKNDNAGSFSGSGFSDGPAGVKTFTVNGVSFNMVPVPGGIYQMGSYDSEAASDELYVHNETVSDFMIGETEVTQELWLAVMGSNPSHFKGAKRPVENISWNSCRDFLNRLNSLTGQNFRMPTEAEWEYAARGGSRSAHYKYSGSDNLNQAGWYDGNSWGATHPVGLKAPNELGIYDMSGNVWEWCYDNYSSRYDQPRSSSYRVLRGGSWFSYASGCRVSYRSYGAPSAAGYDYGFRLAL